MQTKKINVLTNIQLHFFTHFWGWVYMLCRKAHGHYNTVVFHLTTCLAYQFGDFVPLFAVPS